MSCSGSLSCGDYHIVEFDADPDIAGIGVVLAFLLSAWLTLLFVALSYLFVEAFPDESMNRLDLMIVHHARKLKKFIHFPISHKPGQISFDVIQQIVLTLSDQQLITGASIFIVAYVQHCDITQYHFGIVNLLGSASFTTYQCTVMVICHTLRRNQFMKSWRMVWIVAIFIMMIIADMLYYHDMFLAQYGLSTQCVWNNISWDHYASGSAFWLIFSTAFDVWGLVSIIRDLWPDAFDSCIQLLTSITTKLATRLSFLSFRNWYSLSAEKSSQTEPQTIRFILWWCVAKLAFIPFLLYFTLHEIVSSDVVNIWRNFAVLTSVTKRMADLRGFTADNGMMGDENTWGFGQILPMLLLALPLFQVLEMLHDAHKTRKQDEPTVPSQNSDTDQPHPHRHYKESSTINIPPPQRVDTEMGRSSIQVAQPPSTSDSVSDSDSDSSSLRSGKSLSGDDKDSYDALEEQLYSSVFFRAWMGILLLGAYSGTLWGAIQNGVVI